jgi:hypothetical protein
VGIPKGYEELVGMKWISGELPRFFAIQAEDCAPGVVVVRLEDMIRGLSSHLRSVLQFARDRRAIFSRAVFRSSISLTSNFLRASRP